jgi:hypothetical protein
VNQFSRRRSISGQVLVEFALLGSALCVALFYPFVNDTSVAELLWQVLVAMFRTQTEVISIM